MRKGYVYSLICPIENKIRYVGKTINDPKKRLARHKRDWMLEKSSHKISWIKKLKKEGVLNLLKIEILEICEIEKLDQKEKEWIAKLPDLVNTTPGGECGSLNYRHSELAKKKISKAAKRGYTMSEEGKKNIGFSQIGNKKRLGKPHSDESIKKMSKSLKKTFQNGRKIHNSKKVYQYDLDLNFIKEWETGELASKELKITQSNISMCASGQRKTAGNFIWKYEKRLDKDS